MAERSSKIHENTPLQREKEVSKRIVVEVGTGGFPSFRRGNRQKKTDETYITLNLEKLDAQVDKYTMEDRKMKDVFPLVGNAQYVPLADNSVDELIFTNVFGDPAGKYYIDPKIESGYDKMLEEAVRILKPNGIIIITETYTPTVMARRLGLSLEKKDNLYNIRNDHDNSILDSYGLTIDSSSTDQKDVGIYEGQVGSVIGGIVIKLKKKI